MTNETIMLSFQSSMAKLHHNLLHKLLGIPDTENIPEGDVDKLADAQVGDHVSVNGHDIEVTIHVKRMATFAKNARNWVKK